jgi:hypothetical protein
MCKIGTKRVPSLNIINKGGDNIEIIANKKN